MKDEEAFATQRNLRKKNSIMNVVSKNIEKLSAMQQEKINVERMLARLEETIDTPLEARGHLTVYNRYGNYGVTLAVSSLCHSPFRLLKGLQDRLDQLNEEIGKIIYVLDMAEKLFQEGGEEMTFSSSELAEERYPGVTFDCALPQKWVNEMAERGFDVRGHFVTLYPDEGVDYMAPITAEGIRMAAIIASNIEE